MLSPLWSSSCLRWIPGRRLKSASQSRNVDEEQPLASWSNGERGVRSTIKDVILEPASAATMAQCEISQEHQYTNLPCQVFRKSFGFIFSQSRGCGMGRRNLAGDWVNLLSVTFKQTSLIFYSQFRQVATARSFLLVRGAV